MYKERVDKFIDKRNDFVVSEMSSDSLLTGFDLLEELSRLEYEKYSLLIEKLVEVKREKYNRPYNSSNNFTFDEKYVDYILEDLHAITPPSIVRELREDGESIKHIIFNNCVRRMPGAADVVEVADVSSTILYSEAVLKLMIKSVGKMDANSRVLSQYLAMYTDYKLTPVEKEVMLSQLFNIVVTHLRQINIVALNLDAQYV